MNEQQITAMEQPQQERPCTCHPDDNPPSPCPRQYALSECRATAKQPPAAPVQEPVAWAVVGVGDWGEWSIGDQFEISNPPNPEYWETRGYGLVPLYTHPSPAAQRQWVGLTTREIYNLWEDSGVPFVDWDSFASIARAIEAKLREKNGGAA